MADPKTVEARLRVVEVLEELEVAGLLTYTLSTHDLTGPEPQVEIFAKRDAVKRRAPATLSAIAQNVWEELRSGRMQEMVALTDAIKRRKPC